MSSARGAERSNTGIDGAPSDAAARRRRAKGEGVGFERPHVAGPGSIAVYFS